MKLLLCQNADWVPTHGGANKANRALMEALASLGHQCRVVVPTGSMHNHWSRATFRDGLLSRGLRVREQSSNVDVFDLNGVVVEAVTENSPAAALRSLGLVSHFSRVLEEFNPDRVLVASEDRTQKLLQAAVAHQNAPVVFIARSSSMLGVGPLCFFPNPNARKLIARVSTVVANSRYLSQYIKRYTGTESAVLDTPTYDRQANVVGGAQVLMINPCSVKGIEIFLGLADAFPHVQFEAVRGWGTTSTDEAKMRARKNVTLTPAKDDIRSLLGLARVLLVPSLWDESFGRIVVESMLLGVPVLSSDQGGLMESRLGLPGAVSVNPVTGYQNRLDERGIPVAKSGPQDMRPWIAALAQLMEDDRFHAAAVLQSRKASMAYVSTLSVADWDQMIRSS